MGRRTDRMKRALEVSSVARQRSLLRVLRELGVVGQRPATREGAVEFRQALEEQSVGAEVGSSGRKKARSEGIAPIVTKRGEHPKLLLSPDNGGFLPPLSFFGNTGEPPDVVGRKSNRSLQFPQPDPGRAPP